MGDIQLTSAEMAYLWTTYIMDNKSKHILMYIVEKTEDKDIREIMKSALDLCNDTMKKIKKVFNTVNHPIPLGFKDEDVNIKADKLYSDTLTMHLLKIYCIFGLTNFGIALSLVSRPDIKNLFTDSLNATITLSNRVDDAALKKGIFIKTPQLCVPENIEFAHKQNFLGAFLGHRRPLTTLEITHVFNASMISCIGKAQFLGFNQTVKDDRVRNFLNKARKVLEEHIESLNEILKKEDLCAPESLDNEVTSSTEAPFSDRMTMFTTITTIEDILNSYSIAKISTMRKDAFLALTQLSGEIVMLLKDGMDIMIDNGWFEEMPKAVDREDIIKKGN